jgi:hypothetical protein
LFLVAACLACTACGTTGGATGGAADEPEPVLVAEVSTPPKATAGSPPEEKAAGVAVPPAGAATRQPGVVQPEEEFEEVIVEAPRERHEVILDLVGQAQALLRDVELEYRFTGKGRREVLRGRPVAFALWSEARKEWTVAHIEIPRPPIHWTPGRKPLPFTVLTPGVTAKHVRGTGAERLMFSFTAADGEPLKVYGRKFPVFDSDLIARKRWRDVVRTATPIIYLPANDDTLDPQFVSNGRQFLLATAQKAIDELRQASVPSKAYPGTLLADVVPAKVIAALAVIEQTDDTDYRVKGGTAAFEQILSQYGLKREDAYRYSVSRAKAIGPMQFTNSRGNGTYAMVVKRCPAARIDPYFERGAANLLNAMKAAICLFDIELYQMRRDIREPYRGNPEVLGIFPVAAYNGGPRNVNKLYRVMQRMGLTPDDLRAPGEQPAGSPVTCPCLWKEYAGIVRPVSIPKYNNENRWYVQKYQSLLQMFE